MGHTHFWDSDSHTHFRDSDRKSKSSKKSGLKKVSVKEISPKDIPESIFGDDCYSTSLDSASLKLGDFKVAEDDNSRLGKVSVNQKDKNVASQENRVEKEHIYYRKVKDLSDAYHHTKHNLEYAFQAEGRHLRKGPKDSPESLKKRTNGMVKDPHNATDYMIQNMANLPNFLQRTEKEDSFQDRALRFGVLDWSTLEKWNQMKSTKGLRKNFHSPSGSDTSSTLSTMGSSSFSCRSEASHCAKREKSPFKNQQSNTNVHSVPPVRIHNQSYSPPPIRNGRHSVSKNAYLKDNNRDREFTSDEYFDFKLWQGRIVKNSFEELQEDLSPVIEERKPSRFKSSQYSADFRTSEGDNHTVLEAVHGSESDERNPEKGKCSSLSHSEEKPVTGNESPCFFSAGEGSPGTCSERSINLEDNSKQFQEKTDPLPEIIAIHTSKLEDTDCRPYDYHDRFTFPEPEIESCESGVSENVTTKETKFSNVSCPLPSPHHHHRLHSMDFFPNASQDCVKSRHPKCNLEKKFAANSRATSPKYEGKNKVHFEESQSPSRRNQQVQTKFSGLPPNPGRPDNHVPKKVAKSEVFTGCRVSRRSKSFSIAVNPDSTSNSEDFTFTNAKSISVPPVKCPCQNTIHRSGCKLCKKPSVSPLRRWIDPFVKSREKHKKYLVPLSAASQTVYPELSGPMVGGNQETHFESSVGEVDSVGAHKSSDGEVTSFETEMSFVSDKLSSQESSSRCSSPLPKEKALSERTACAFDDKEPKAEAASSSPTTLQGLLHFMYRNGLPYFTFSPNDSEEIFAAKTWKVDKYEGDDFDWMYSFHSGKSQNKKKHKTSWINWGKKDPDMTALVGKMKVSSSLASKLNKFGTLEHMVETEFVLVGTNKEIANSNPVSENLDNRVHFPFSIAGNRFSASDISAPTSVLTKSETCKNINHESLMANGQKQKREGSIAKYPFRHSFSEAYQSSSKISTSASRKNTENSGKESNVLNPESLEFASFSSFPELAAIVIRIPLERRESVKSGPLENVVLAKSAGWGLKFLEKFSGGTTSETTSHHSGSYSTSDARRGGANHSFKKLNFPIQDASLMGDDESENSGIFMNAEVQEQTSITVIIPEGIHSLPNSSSCYPSSLADRWKSSGKCDCEGWDLGCPLTIIDNYSSNKSTPKESLEAESFPPSELYIQGVKESRPALSLAMVHDGLYLLSFQSPISALQAFSIGVAMLHSREPLMSTKEIDMQDSWSSQLVDEGTKQAKTLSQEISTSQYDCHVTSEINHDVFMPHLVPDPPPSPIGRV